jgi:hypothetical protein
VGIRKINAEPQSFRNHILGLRLARVPVGKEIVKVVVPVDLLKLIDPKKDAIEGNWAFLDNKLVAPGGHKPNRLLVRYRPPLEYEIEMVVQRINEKPGQLNIGLVVGDRQTVVCVDGFGGLGISGLETVDGKAGESNETTYRGRLLPLARPTTIRVQVRNREIILTCQERTIFHWKGETARLGLHPWWAVPKGTLFLGSQEGIQIHQMILRPLGARPPGPPAMGYSNRNFNEGTADSLLRAGPCRQSCGSWVAQDVGNARSAARYSARELSDAIHGQVFSYLFSLLGTEQ